MVERSHTAGWWPTVYEPMRQAGEKIADWFAPKSDAAVSEENYTINVELPGVFAGDVEVTMHDGSVIVQGEKRRESEETGNNYFFSEREYGAFLRTFRLPPDADQERVSADFRGGVLTIKVPKVGSAPGRSKRVEIRTSE
jgi:HSP20 family protein